MPDLRALVNATAFRLPFADRVFHAVAASPPYMGLRLYQGQQEFLWPGGMYVPTTGAPACIEVPDWTGSLGGEETPEAYVWHTLLILRELRRVLRDDGTIWWVIGDSYATDPGNGRGGETVDGGTPHRSAADKTKAGLSQGNLIGIPARVMLAAQADGWIVRNDCVFAKAAPMPESVRGWSFQQETCGCVKSKQERALAEAMQRTGADRATAAGYIDREAERAPNSNCPNCNGTGRVGEPRLQRGSWRHTRAHETVLMLVKEMQYFADGEAVKEKAATDKWPGIGPQHGETRDRGEEYKPMVVHGRNPRSVLTPAAESYPGQHYAVFPSSLIRPLIQASVPKHCCPQCGAGWAAVVETERRERPNGGPSPKRASLNEGGVETSGLVNNMLPETRVIAYRPTCTCGVNRATPDPIPGIVLDPFVGSGTTVRVARELGLRAVGVDVSFDYLDLQARVRGLNQTSAKSLAELPLFQEL